MQLYKLLPDVELAWRSVWMRAVASVYGAAGALIVVLLWVCYSAQIVFFGAEITKAYARRFPAPRSVAGRAAA